MADPDNQGSDPPKKPNTYFAGNGQAVEGAGDGQSGSHQVDELFRKARENGARPPEEHTTHRSTNFTGAGRRLGHEAGPSLPVQPLTRDERKVKITFFRNGFSVDDGDLVNSETPEGRAFLETLNKGFVPRSIAEKYPNTDITVALEDRADQDYVRTFKAFEGSGNRLTGPAPAGAGAPRNQNSEAPSGTFEFRDDEPSSKVVLQMVDGTKKEVRVNPQRHTVADLRGVVATAARCSPFDFDLVVRELRPRTLADASQTLADAKAANCLILVKAR
jgi:UBX domain-containing protein 1